MSLVHVYGALNRGALLGIIDANSFWYWLSKIQCMPLNSWSREQQRSLDSFLARTPRVSKCCF